MNSKKRELIVAAKTIYHGEITDEVLVEIYNTATLMRGNYDYSRYKDYLNLDINYYPVMPGLIDDSSFSVTMELFGSLSEIEFFTFIIPEYVADIEALKRYLAKYPHENWEITKKIKNCNKTKILQEHKDISSSSYTEFCRLEGDARTVKPKAFDELYAAVNQYTIRREVGSRQTYKLLDAFKALNMEGIQPEKILKMILEVSRRKIPQIKNYTTKSSTESFDGVFRDALQSVWHCESYMPAVQAVYLLQNQYNDVGLEDGYIYRKILADTDVWDSEKEIVIIGGSPFLIQKIIMSETLKNKHKIFVVDDDNVVSIFATEFWKNKSIDFYCSGNGMPEELKGTVFIIATNIEYGIVAEDIKNVSKAGAETICIFGNCVDIEMKKNRELLIAALSEDMNINEIDLLPSSLKYTSIPKKKFYACITKFKKEDLHIHKVKYSRIDEKGNQILTKQKLSVPITFGSFCEGSITLNNAYRTGEIVYCSMSTSKRKLPVSLAFSNEILIWITQSKQSNGMITTLATIHNPLENNVTSLTRKKIKRGERYSKATKRKTTATRADGIEWACEEYLYSGITRREQGIRESVRDIFSTKYKESLYKKESSLKTLLYVDSEYENALNEKERKLLRQYINKTDIGNMTIQEITIENVERLTDSLNMSDNEKQVSITLLSNYIDHCIENNICSNNPLSEIDEKQKRNGDKQYAQVRDVLGVRFLYPDKLRELYTDISKEIKRERMIYIGSLIQLLTGLEANVVCALTWGDYIKTEIVVNGISVWIIDVKRQVTNDGTERRPFKKESSYRKIVCPEVLSTILIQEKERLVANGKSEEALQRESIVSGSLMKVESGVLTCPPRELLTITKTLLEKLAVPDVVVDVPYFGKGIIENNLSSIRGEILKTNYEHYMRVLVHMENDEINYIMGRARDTTIGQHYIDYAHPVLMAKRYIKLAKWEEMFV